MLVRHSLFSYGHQLGKKTTTAPLIQECLQLYGAYCQHYKQRNTAFHNEDNFLSSGIVPHRFGLKTLVNISCGKGFFGVIIKKILVGLLGLSRATRDVAPRLSDILQKFACKICFYTQYFALNFTKKGKMFS